MGKIGIMGGTFDPIHNGHLRLGGQAYKEFCLDQVWFMPSGIPPHKKNRIITDAQMRTEMVELAIEGHPGFFCSDFEINRTGNTYTAQTLQLLHQYYPQHTFYFIIGADSLYEIESWHEPSIVMALAVILAANREYQDAKIPIAQQIAYLREKYHADIRLLHCGEIDISSARLRSMAAMGNSLTDWVPKAVETYINLHHLYQ